MNKKMLYTVAASVAAIAVIYRVPQARDLLTGANSSGGGWFSWM
ncbi:MAG: hypothetical protein PF501_14715 [Salinisphaera sp.]|jgi:hypothetical protein|nr:hypothetical protein [Salinisphaera sp.]